MQVGRVYLVGAGPGDPGLLTVRGLELVRRAEVIVYDQLVNPLLLEEAPLAIKIFAGKQAGPNPWGAEGLEWQTPSPPPTANFERTPVVTQEAYAYASELEGHRV